MTQTDLDYYTRRRDQELALAASAALEDVAEAHTTLALYYEAKARDLLRRRREPALEAGEPTVLTDVGEPPSVSMI